MNGLVTRVCIYTIAGLLAGFLTWCFSDLTGLVHLTNYSNRLTAGDIRAQYTVSMVWGSCVGVLLGLADILLSGSYGQWPKAIGFGIGVGLLSGVFGLLIGMTLFGSFYVHPVTNPIQFVVNVFARAIGWAAIGALAGTADGWRKGSVRVGRNGFIGGLIGGLIGGSAFEVVPEMAPGQDVGAISRMIAFLITGACIGLFISLVQELFKEAWIRVVLGRNEGKEYLLDKAQTTIGRSELADIPLFGDAAIAKVHAVVAVQPSGGFAVQPSKGMESPVLVNGARVMNQQSLVNGDEIRIAGRVLQFHERVARNRPAPAPRDVPPPVRRPMPTTEAGTLLRSDVLGASGAFSAATLASGVSASATVPVSPAQAMRLVAIAGNDSGASYSLVPGAEVTIGRDPGSVTIALTTDTRISRHHARLLQASNGRWVIEDLGSTNGTYVNGERVTRQELVRGDTLLVGTTALRLE